MSWFKKNKSQVLIPPVDDASSTRDGRGSAPPSYRSSASTYVASRDGDLSQRSYSNSSYQPSSTSRYGDNYNPAPTNDRVAPSDYLSTRSRWANDPYAKGERDLDRDRNVLFSGAADAGNEHKNMFMEGPGGRDPPPPGEEGEDDVEGIKQQTRFLKQDTVQSSRNALRIAREAEEAGRATLLRLGEQSEKLANTERHLDVSKGHSLRAEDNADEIKKLNRSIFIPAITFNKSEKRAAQDRKREMRFREENEERDQAMSDVRESHNRLGRAATFGNKGATEGDEEGVGPRRLTALEQAKRKEERKRYQFEATASDDELEDEIDDNMDEILSATQRMKALGLAMGAELDSQNNRIDRIATKADKLTFRIDNNTSKLKRIK